MVSGDVTTIKDYWLMLLPCGDVVTTFYSLADVIAKDVADVIDLNIDLWLFHLPPGYNICQPHPGW